MIGALANHLWQSTLFLVGAGLLALLLRHNRARMRYGIWLAASVKFLIPFAALVALGGGLVSTPVARSVVRRIPVPVVPIPVQRVAQPFPRVEQSAPPMAVAAAVTAPGPAWIPHLLVGAWMVGFLAVTGMRIRGWRALCGTVRISQTIDLSSRNVPASVQVRTAAGMLEPAVIGILNPVLLVPEGIADRLTPAQLETVLAHEIRHVGRRDSLTAVLHMVVEALFWFYPPVWWLGTRLVHERERACDEEVLLLGHDPHVYAEAVLSVCKHFRASSMKCASGISGADVKRRLERIAANVPGQPLGFARAALLILAGLLTMPGPFIFGLLQAGSLPESVHAQVGAGPASLEKIAEGVKRFDSHAAADNGAGWRAQVFAPSEGAAVVTMAMLAGG